jgi:hypothetical protein
MLRANNPIDFEVTLMVRSPQIVLRSLFNIMFRSKVAAAFMAAVQTAVIAFGLAAMPVAALAAPASTACDPNTLSLQNGVNCASPDETRNKTLFAPGGIFQTISRILIFIVGAVAVIMLIIGGLRYVLSAGDAKNVTAAKDTILYAIIGIVVALLSFALVQFVVTSLGNTTTTKTTTTSN